MEKPSRKLKKTFLILGVTGAVYASFKYLLPLVIPFLIAYIFALALRPSAVWLEKKCRFTLKRKEVHLPLAVIGGLEVYLFGAIAAQGIAIMIEKKVDMFSSKNIAVIASIMVIGIGGQYAFGGNIPFFGLQVPCIAGAAIFGIVLNLLLSIGEKKVKAEKE